MNTSKVTENFLRYVKIDTQSREEFADHVPSTEKQRNLAKLLYQELLDMGLDIPEVTRVFLKLQQMGLPVQQVYTVEQAVEQLQRLKGGYDHA